MAETYAQRNENGPVNILWMYYLVRDNRAEAQAIWDKHLTNTSRLMFQNVLRLARRQNDEDLSLRLLKYLKDSKISEKALGTAFSCLIDIQTANGSIDKAQQSLTDAISHVCLENINHTALKRLKLALEAEGKEFPYDIPTKNSSKVSLSSSSSGSDDDVAEKRVETVSAASTK